MKKLKLIEGKLELIIFLLPTVTVLSLVGYAELCFYEYVLKLVPLSKMPAGASLGFGFIFISSIFAIVELYRFFSWLFRISGEQERKSRSMMELEEEKRSQKKG